MQSFHLARLLSTSFLPYYLHHPTTTHVVVIYISRLINIYTPYISNTVPFPLQFKSQQIAISVFFFLLDRTSIVLSLAIIPPPASSSSSSFSFKTRSASFVVCGPYSPVCLCGKGKESKKAKKQSGSWKGDIDDVGYFDRFFGWGGVVIYVFGGLVQGYLQRSSFSSAALLSFCVGWLCSCHSSPPPPPSPPPSSFP